MDYDYNKLFAETYGFTHEEDLNHFDRSYDPDDFSDYEEYDTDHDEDILLQDYVATVPEVKPVETSEEAEELDLEQKFNQLNRAMFDNKFKHVEDPLFFTTSEKKQIHPLLSKIEGTQDQDEVFQALTPQVRGHVSDNEKVFQFTEKIIDKIKPPAVAENFSLHSKEFFSKDRPEEGFLYFEKMRRKLREYTDDEDIINVLEFDDHSIPVTQTFNVYIPTYQQRLDYYDRHKNEARIIEEFHLSQQFQQQYDKFQDFKRRFEDFEFELECLWFRHRISMLDKNQLAKSLLVVSHPMMIPSPMRQQFNELSVIPENYDFHDQQQSFRFFELLFVRKKHRIFLPDRRIHLYVLKFFKVYFSSFKLRFVKKLPPIYRRLNIMDLFHPTSNVIENLTRIDVDIPYIYLSKEQIVTGLIHSTHQPPINLRRYKFAKHDFKSFDYSGEWKKESFTRFKH